MAETETLNNILTRLIVEDGLDIEVATDKAIAMLPKAQLAKLVRPLVRDQARRIARRVARRLENATFTRRPTTRSSTPASLTSAGGTPQTRPQARRAITASTFVTPDGRWVPWGKATPDDHLARAGWQRSQATQQIVDATRHEAAARLIKKHKATCLDDIDGWPELLRDAA